MLGGITDDCVSHGKADAINECLDAGVRAMNPNVTVGPSTSAASILNEGLTTAGRRRGQVIAAAGSNEAVANSRYSATIRTLLPVAPDRPNASPDQISARLSAGARSTQTSSVDPRAHLRSGIAMSRCGKRTHAE
jgi:hypothetical protein